MNNPAHATPPPEPDVEAMAEYRRTGQTPARPYTGADWRVEGPPPPETDVEAQRAKIVAALNLTPLVPPQADTETLNTVDDAWLGLSALLQHIETLNARILELVEGHAIQELSAQVEMLTRKVEESELKRTLGARAQREFYEAQVETLTREKADRIVEMGTLAAEANYAEAKVAEAERVWRDRALLTRRLHGTEAKLAEAEAALLWVAENYPKVMREMPGELFHPLRSLRGEDA